ncbi:hypothetical protein T439DRAFT_378750 [Meredithblackwellia eburnea MCA 4105]
MLLHKQHQLAQQHQQQQQHDPQNSAVSPIQAPTRDRLPPSLHPSLAAPFPSKHLQATMTTTTGSDSPASSDPIDHFIVNNHNSQKPTNNFTALLLGQVVVKPPPPPRFTTNTLTTSHAPSNTSRDENAHLLSSSSSPHCSPASSSTIIPLKRLKTSPPSETPNNKARRTVKFSSMHLDSLQSSPRHSVKSSYFPTRLTSRSVYSSGWPVGNSTDPAEEVPSSPTRVVLAPINDIKLSSITCMDEDEEPPTDDEAEDVTVFNLLTSSPTSSLPLMSISRPPNSLPLPPPSPCRPPPIHTPVNSAPAEYFLRQPTSILKKTKYPIAQANSLTEGSRLNGGRRKHALGWWDADAAAGIFPSDAAQVPTVEVADGGDGSGKGESSSKAKGEVTEKAREVRNGGSKSTCANEPSPNGAGGTDGEDGNDPPEKKAPSSNTPAAPTAQPRIQRPPDDDPINFRVPLITLRSSLRPTTTQRRNHASSPASDIPGGLYPRHIPPTKQSSPLHESMRGVLPSVIGATMDSPIDDTAGIPSSTSSVPLLPVTLPEIEFAYGRLVRALIRLPKKLPDAERTLAPLREFRGSLLQSLERDISNITSFPDMVAANVRRRKAAGVSSEAAGGSGTDSAGSSPLRASNHVVPTRSGLSEEDMRRQKDEVSVASVAIKVVAAIAQDPRLHSYFSNAELHELVSKILAIPGTPRLSGSVQKDVYPFIAWFVGVQRFPDAFIKAHVDRILDVLRITLTTFDKPRNNISESITAIHHLLGTHSTVILSNWHKWFKHVAEGLWEGPKKGTVVKTKALKTLGALATLLTLPGGSEDPEATVQRTTTADLISKQFLEEILYRKKDGGTMLSALATQLDNALRTHEAVWVVHVLAIIPVLLHIRFRKLEPKGIKPWIQLVSKCRDHEEEDVRLLSGLLWNHLAYAFLKTPAEDASVWWIFRPDRKPFNLLTQIFTQSGIWLTQKKQKEHAIYSIVLGGVLYGLGILNRGLPAAPPSSSIIESSEESKSDVVDLQLENLDFVWDHVVIPCVQPALRGISVEIVNHAWDILAALFNTEDPVPPPTDLSTLLNPIFFEGVAAKSKGRHDATMVSRGAALSCPASIIPAWPSRWITIRVPQVLRLMSQGLSLDDLSEAVMEPSDPSDNMLRFWNRFIERLNDDCANPASLLLIVNWLIQAWSKLPSVTIKLAASFLSMQRQGLGGENASPALEGALGTFIEVTTQPHDSFPTAQDVPSYSKLLVTFLQAMDGDLARSLLQKLSVRAVMLPEEGEELCSFAVREWTYRLERKSAINELELQALLGLIDHKLATVAKASTEQWLAFGRVFGTAVLECDSHNLWELFASRFSPPTQPAEDSRLLCFIITSTPDLPRKCHERTIPLVREVLNGAFVNPSGDFVEPISSLLLALPDEMFVPLYIEVLGKLKLTTKSHTSAELIRITPVLARPLARVFGLQGEQPQEPLVTCQDVLSAFNEFWRGTFASNDTLEIGSDLSDLLSIVRGVSSDFDIPNLGETQASGGSHRRESSSLESAGLPPPAGQPLPSIANVTPQLSSACPPGDSGFLADKSGDVDSSIEISSGRALSPSLCMPGSTDVIHGELQETVGDVSSKDSQDTGGSSAPEIHEIQETPAQVQDLRSSKSIASLASGGSSAADLAQAMGSQVPARSLRTRNSASASPAPASRPLSRAASSTSPNLAASDSLILGRRKSQDSEADSPSAKKAKFTGGHQQPPLRKRNMIAFVEIPSRPNLKRTMPSSSVSPPAKRLKEGALPAEEEPPVGPFPSSFSSAGDLTDRESGDDEAEMGVEKKPVTRPRSPSIPTIAKDAIRSFLEHTSTLSPRAIIKESGSRGMAHLSSIVDYWRNQGSSP